MCLAAMELVGHAHLPRSSTGRHCSRPGVYAAACLIIGDRPRGQCFIHPGLQNRIRLRTRVCVVDEGASCNRRGRADQVSAAIGHAMPSMLCYEGSANKARSGLFRLLISFNDYKTTSQTWKLNFYMMCNAQRLVLVMTESTRLPSSISAESMLGLNLTCRSLLSALHSLLQKTVWEAQNVRFFFRSRDSDGGFCKRRG